jgi:hypothetical protein
MAVHTIPARKLIMMGNIRGIGYGLLLAIAAIHDGEIGFSGCV